MKVKIDAGKLSELNGLKMEGARYFKSKNFASAVESFGEAIEKIIRAPVQDYLQGNRSVSK